MTSGLHPSIADGVLEADRVAAVASSTLVGSPPELEFDRLTELTARVAGAPVSLVALLDDEKSYFKSTFGVPEIPEGRAVPLSHSLCQIVVGTGEPVAIDDTQAHPLARDNGAVTDMGVGAYLGVPVRAPSGHVLGSLCAVDFEARSWTDADRTSLVSLAASVEGEIALREELEERQAAEARALAEADALEAVVGVNAQLAAELDPDRLVQAVVEAGVATTGAATGAFFYRPADAATEAVLFAATGVPRAVLEAFAVVERSPGSNAAFAEPVFVDDVQSDPAWSWVVDLVGDALEVRSMAGVPVQNSAGEPIGTLHFGHPEAGVFDARAQRSAIAIADQAAIALQNARLHRALDESERRHRTVLAGLSDVVFQTDAAGLYTYLNDAWADHTGHAVADTLGRSFLDFATSDVDGLASRFADAASRAERGTSSTDDFEVAVRCADGSARYFEARSRSTFGADGAVNGSAGTLTDVTDRVRYHSEREAREAAEAARAEAERMAQLQNSFLANMSHEIRTPLTAILGNAEFLADEAPDDLGDLAASIHRGGERLMATLDSVLDLAQIDAGHMEVQPRAADVRAHLMSILHKMVPLAQAKGIGLAADIGADIPEVMIDAALLDRAVSNLVGNAVKFTSHGSVTLRARRDQDRLTIRVEDTGVGIPADALPYLFDPFRQASEGHARAYEGNGLGLAITSRVAGLLGGDVTVESEPGVGSVFVLEVAAPVASHRMVAA